MSAESVPWLVAAVLVPLLMNEFKEWWPWLAARLVRWAAQRLGDSQACARYEEEWVANLQEVPGHLSPLLAAFGYLAAVPRMRWTLRRGFVLLKVRPQQLPHDVAFFVGRAAEIASLDAHLVKRSRNKSTSRGTSVVVVCGTAGVGKTSLVVRWAHRHPTRFPDGILYVSLRGFSPGEPLAPEEVLGELLCALGVHAAHIPASLDERALLYRTITARRRVLVVLDNAASASQVRPLLLDSPRSMVLITSRSRLSGLVAREGAYCVTLDVLPNNEGVELLRGIVGAGRVDAELEAAKELVRLCAHLPLALRIACERAVSRPQTSLHRIVQDLRDESTRWEALSGQDIEEDGATAISTVFSWSYRVLSPHTAHLFRRLGALPSTRRSFTRNEAALLAECTVTEAGRHLDRLAHAHLVEPSTPLGTYRVHELVHAYAANLLASNERHRLADLRKRLDPPGLSQS